MSLEPDLARAHGLHPAHGAFALLGLALVVACSGPGPAASPAATAASPPATAVSAPDAATSTSLPSPVGSTASPGPTAGETPPAPPPNLSRRPLAWFAPLPPLPTGPGREFTGSDDFMDLFAPNADWGEAGERVDVLKLYGEWVAYAATPAELQAVVAMARELGLALAVEAGPLDPTASCGQGVEGFAGLDEARRIAARVKAAGGRIDLVAMDEPWFFGHVYRGPGACAWDLERIARGVVAFRDTMRETFPEVIVGDTEALPRDVDPAGLIAWLDVYRAEAGEPLPFLHLDLDFGAAGWPQTVAGLAGQAHRRGTQLGLIAFGDPSDTSDEAWYGTAAARILAAGDAGGGPDHILFQSWQDRPDRVLPAAGPSTWTWFIAQWAAGADSLARLLPPPNLASGRTARASATLAGSRPAHAIDGDPGTDWSSGTGPPAWIEVDLGSPRQIGLVRLRATQFPEGVTDHRLLGRGDASAGWVELARFRGRTRDGQSLEWRPDEPLSGIRHLRVETIESPSWVAWREIEVYLPSP